MQEHFIVSIPSSSPPKWVKTLLTSLIISFIIIYPLGIGSIPSICSFIIMTFIFYLLINNMSENMSGSLPFTTTPNPPHTGLDGIDVNNLIAGIPANVIGRDN